MRRFVWLTVAVMTAGCAGDNEEPFDFKALPEIDCMESPEEPFDPAQAAELGITDFASVRALLEGEHSAPLRWDDGSPSTTITLRVDGATYFRVRSTRNPKAENPVLCEDRLQAHGAGVLRTADGKLNEPFTGLTAIVQMGLVTASLSYEREELTGSYTHPVPATDCFTSTDIRLSVNGAGLQGEIEDFIWRAPCDMPYSGSRFYKMPVGSFAPPSPQAP